MHEENSFIDCGLTKKGRQRHNKHEHWKKVWVNEVKHKINSREIDMMNDERKVEIKMNKIINKTCS